VLRHVARSGAATLSELSRELRVPKSTMTSICAALVDEGLLAMGPSREFVLGTRVLELAEQQAGHRAPVGMVGLTVQNSTNPFFDAEIAAVRGAAALLDVEVAVEFAEQDPERQVRQIDELVARGAGAVIVDAVHSTHVASAVARARSAGVPVVAVNVGAQGADAMVSTDNTRAGYLVGKLIASRLDGAGRVAIGDGTFVTATADRVSGFLAALRECPRLELVAHRRGDHTEESGARVAAEMLAGSAPIDAFFGINDPTAVGIVGVVDSGTVVAGVDGSRAAVDLIEAGRMAGTAAQDPVQLARIAFDLAIELAKGYRPAARTRLLQPQLITPANLHDYRAWDEER
jgi:ribose transport system substrate-binding protein